ncbi:MAG TPA: hypothetical protein VF424_17735 [Vicinamibacterales bacterium]
MKDERKLSTSDIAAASDRDIATDRPAARRLLEREPPAARQADPRQPPVDGPRPNDDEPLTQLFAAEDAAGYRTRWGGIQTGFVDEPRRAVQEADTLVAEVMKRLAEGFANERRELEGRWERTDQVSTEDLRLAMRRYRAFFERLLAV